MVFRNKDKTLPKTPTPLKNSPSGTSHSLEKTLEKLKNAEAIFTDTKRSIINTIQHK